MKFWRQKSGTEPVLEEVEKALVVAMDCCCQTKYRLSYGNHRPICNGVCLMAHTGWENLTPVSLGFIFIPTFCWYWFLVDEVNDYLTAAFPTLIGLNVVITVIFLLLTMLTEPGILPTITYEEYSDDNAEVPVRIISRILLDGREYELRQFRAKFSRCTANCIENFDHYCPWVGNAIGKRNYRYFVFFMSSCLILALQVAASCTALLVTKSIDQKKSFVSTMEESVATTVLAIYGYCMMFSLVGLCGFHIQAIATNVTTNEILKGVYAQGNINPHDQGCYNNCWTFFCAPISQSRIAERDAESPLLGIDHHFMRSSISSVSQGEENQSTMDSQDLESII